jgi:hypothetical protein
LACRGRITNAVIAALCANIVTLRGNDDEEFPLRDFKSAQALVHIGGSRARQAIFESLRQPIDRTGLLIRAHTLGEIDPPQIMCEHIKMAIAKEENRQKAKLSVDEQYLGKLRILQDWLSNPEFLEDRQNWPGRLQSNP